MDVPCRAAGCKSRLVVQPNGAAAATRIDSAAKATTRHSDSEPSASDAATAWVKREEAMRAGRLPNPWPVASDRIMAVNPSWRGRITRVTEMCQQSLSGLRRNASGFWPNRGGPTCRRGLCPLFTGFPRGITLPRPDPRHWPGCRASSSSARSVARARPASARPAPPDSRTGRSRTGWRHGYSHRARCPRR